MDLQGQAQTARCCAGRWPVRWPCCSPVCRAARRSTRGPVCFAHAQSCASRAGRSWHECSPSEVSQARRQRRVSAIPAAWHAPAQGEWPCSHFCRARLICPTRMRMASPHSTSRGPCRTCVHGIPEMMWTLGTGTCRKASSSGDIDVERVRTPRSVSCLCNDWDSV